LKFQIKLSPEELADQEAEAIKGMLHRKIFEIYRQREIEFPVRVGMARFMADRQTQPGAGHRYDREGLLQWARQRFEGAASPLNEEDFRTQSRARLQDMLLEVSRQYYSKTGQEELDSKLEEVMSGTEAADPDDARELADWVKTELGLEIAETDLIDRSSDAIRQILWNLFDERYRPEMHGMERGLLLGRLDASWKNHLYTMDHLRSGIGLVSYAQVDPKTEYKRQGMKEFDAMWEGVQEKVSESVFRMEEEEGFQESVWQIGATIHESAPQALPMESMRGQQDAAITNSQSGQKKLEPIRNRGERVGRNDPCPCGSGKKYKNCHMRQAAG
jgi:preprotein translocase subunit SecA